MKAQPECFCCSIRQAQEATEIAGKIKTLFGKFLKEFVQFMLELTKTGLLLI